MLPQGPLFGGFSGPPPAGSRDPSGLPWPSRMFWGLREASRHGCPPSVSPGPPSIHPQCGLEFLRVAERSAVKLALRELIDELLCFLEALRGRLFLLHSLRRAPLPLGAMEGGTNTHLGRRGRRGRRLGGLVSSRGGPPSARKIGFCHDLCKNCCKLVTPKDRKIVKI